MATLVADLLTEIYRRTRDPNRTATPEALGIQFLSQAQEVLNVYLKSTLDTVTFTLSANRLLYQLSTEMPDCARVEAVRVGTRDLVELPWTQLWQLDKQWFRRIDSANLLQHWARVGRDMLVVYPGPLTAMDVSIVCTPFLGPLTALTDEILLRHEFFPMLLDLTEALFLLRLRIIAGGSASMVNGA